MSAPTHRSPSLRYFKVHFYLVSLLAALSFASLEVQPVMAQTDKGKEEPPPVVIDKDIANLIPVITELSINRLDMLDELQRLTDTESIRKQLEALTARKDEFKVQVDSLATAPDMNRERLITIQTELDDNLSNARQTSALIASQIGEFDKWIDYWAAEEKKIGEWVSGLGRLDHLPSVQSQMDHLTVVIEDAKAELDNNIHPLLAMQEQVGDVQISLHGMNLAIDRLFADIFSFSIRTTAFFSQEYFSQFNTDLLVTLADNFKLFLQPDIEELQTYPIQIALCFALFGLLSSVLNRFRPVISSSSK